MYVYDVRFRTLAEIIVLWTYEVDAINQPEREGQSANLFLARPIHFFHFHLLFFVSAFLLFFFSFIHHQPFFNTLPPNTSRIPFQQTTPSRSLRL